MSRLKLVLLSLLIAACARNSTGPVAAESPVSAISAKSLADSLRRTGLPVEDAGFVEQPFFTVRAHVFRVDGADLQVYDFASAAAAQQAAAQVSPSGGAIGTTHMSWMAPPHFFRKDRVIVNYLGSSPKVLEELQKLLGAQFAGGT